MKLARIFNFNEYKWSDLVRPPIKVLREVSQVNQGVFGETSDKLSGKLRTFASERILAPRYFKLF